MKNMDITLASNCYEKSYMLVLNSDWGGKVFLQNNKDIFKKRILTINDIEDRSEILPLLEDSISMGLIDEYYWCEDNFDNVKKVWKGLERDTYKEREIHWKRFLANAVKKRPLMENVNVCYDGYVYSIAPLVAISQCNTRWLLWCAEDSYIDDQYSLDWIFKAINIMQDNDEFLAACPCWNDFEGGRHEAIAEIGDFYVSEGFSDQCFLIDVKKIKSIPEIFLEKSAYCKKKYPRYGANCFERRINAYMRNNKKRRLVYKYAIYHHLGLSCIGDAQKFEG